VKKVTVTVEDTQELRGDRCPQREIYGLFTGPSSGPVGRSAIGSSPMTETRIPCGFARALLPSGQDFPPPRADMWTTAKKWL
jgi:hypothetical protein